MSVRAEDWPAQSLPAHLQPRVEVVDRRNKTVVAGRDLSAIQTHVEKRDNRSDAWEKATRQWERHAVSAWTFGDLPESILVEEVAGAPLLAYPGLAVRDAEVNVRLFRKREEAEAASVRGVQRLGELVLARDLARLWKELGGLAKHLHTPANQAPGFHAALHQISAKIQSPAVASTSAELLQKSAFQHLTGHTLRLTPTFPLTETRFIGMAEKARRDLPGLAYQLGERIKQLLDLRQKILASPKRYPGLERDLDRLVGGDFPATTPHTQMPHIMRYLKAVQIRAERAAVSPAKDAEKAKQMTPFADWEKRVPAPQREAFRWMLEEFRVSIFAQELGTAQSTSAARLQTLAGYSMDAREQRR